MLTTFFDNYSHFSAAALQAVEQAAHSSPVIWDYLAVFGMSMLPVIELKGSIPVGISLGIPELQCFIVAVFGSIVLSPFIIILTRRVLEVFMKSRIRLLQRFGTWQHSRLAKKGGKLEKYKNWFLFILVAIPLPTTGVWTGSMVAGLFEIRLRTALPIIFLGNLIAGLIVFYAWPYILLFFQMLFG